LEAIISSLTLIKE